MSSRIKRLVGEVGKRIESKLDPHPMHAKRNPYAHIYGVIKNVTGVTYTETDEETCVKILKLVLKYPNDTSEEIKQRLENGEID